MTKRDRLMLMAVVGLALLGGFWMFVLSPQRKAATAAAGKVTTAQAALESARQQVTAGRVAQQAFRRDRTTIVKLGRVVPESDDIPTLLTQLQTLATKEKVKFQSYQIDSNGSENSSATTSGASETPSASAGAQTGSGSTAAVAPLYPPGSVKIDGGLGRTPIALEFEGTYFQLERYLRAVQRFAVISQKSLRTNGRLMIVDGFSYKAAEATSDESSDTKAKVREFWNKQPKLVATLSASVYFAPPLQTPSATGSAASASTPAAGAAAPSGSTTGTAAIGGVQ